MLKLIPKKVKVAFIYLKTKLRYVVFLTTQMICWLLN